MKSYRVGDRLHCAFRDRYCAVAGISDAPAQWPYTAHGRGGPSLIVFGELLADVRRLGHREVAEKYGVSTATARRWRLRFGVREVRYWTPEEESQFDGAPAAEIARRVGRTKSAVQGHRHYRRKVARPLPETIVRCKTGWPPCSACGQPDGPTWRGHTTPTRISLSRFGRDGVGCGTCYNRLARESRASRPEDQERHR